MPSKWSPWSPPSGNRAFWDGKLEVLSIRFAGATFQNLAITSTAPQRKHAIGLCLVAGNLACGSFRSYRCQEGFEFPVG